MIGNNEIIQNVRDKKIIAIARGIEPEESVALMEALYAGGINMIEITFDQSDHGDLSKTTKAIENIAQHFKGRAYVGAGTVLTCRQAEMAKGAGAEFIITPNTDTEVIRHIKKLGMVAMPGALSPTEAVQAYSAGADFVKLFPIDRLGSDYLKAIVAPLSHIPFLAVGGIDEKNIGVYLKAGAVGAGVGGNLVNKKWIKEGAFSKITGLAEEMVKNVGSYAGAANQ